jgi:SAM-dependent MidA family methyltransferase
MTPLGILLKEEIGRNGPIDFARFMDAALYHPEFGYYRRARDPFGVHGDFFTAEQLQPVFGNLIAAAIRNLRERMGAPADFVVVELGAGRQEMASAFSEFRYVPIDTAHGRLPQGFRGVVFSNEFFDALPVRVAAIRESGPRELRVGVEDDRFVWVEGEPAGEEVGQYIRKYFSSAGAGTLIEINLEALRWIERIAEALEAGYVLTIDFGYTARETARFPQGTLMSYRKHMAFEDVLQDPGERDIAAHVCFTALERHGDACGLRRLRFETLAQTLMAAGEADQFAAALAGESTAEEAKRRLQLKQLLFGMGETFRVLLQEKSGQK